MDGGSAFRVRVHGALVFPYKPDGEEPWDWDGNVPDWMIDLSDALGDILVSPELKTASEILQIVDEVAPIVLEGTTPPDPIVAVVAALDTSQTRRCGSTCGTRTSSTTTTSAPLV